MASLTIRKLDETIKVYLRLRSARNGRSVEEEVRVILGGLIEGRPEFPATPSPTSLPPADAQSRPARGTSAPEQPRVTLIIGGGIAADDQGDAGLFGRTGAPCGAGLGVCRRQTGWRWRRRELGATLYKSAQDHPDLLFYGAAVAGRT